MPPIPFGTRQLYRDRRLVEGDGTPGAGFKKQPYDAGTLARCGCRWNDDTERLDTKPGCSVHTKTRRARGDCPKCSDRRWLPVGAGWDGWFLRVRCSLCNALEPQEELHELVRRIAPCRKTWKQIEKLRPMERRRAAC